MITYSNIVIVLRSNYKLRNCFFTRNTSLVWIKYYRVKAKLFTEYKIIHNLAKYCWKISIFLYVHSFLLILKTALSCYRQYLISIWRIDLPFLFATSFDHRISETNSVATDLSSNVQKYVDQKYQKKDSFHERCIST